MICCIITLIIVAALVYGFMKLDSNPLLAFYAHFYPNQNELKNTVVWVVGASTGIGEALAYRFAELGAKGIVLTSTSEKKLQEVKQRCLEKSGNQLKSDDILVLAYDISDYKKSDEALQKILSKFGKIDIVLNNAARLLSSKIVENRHDDDFKATIKLFEINLFANMYLAKLVTYHWTSKKLKGLIMATSSIGAYCDLPFHSAYTNSKRALQGFYADLSIQHHRDDITVCIICPGPVCSDLGKKSIIVNNRRVILKPDDKLMSAERCADLITIAIANKLYLSWISIQPYLLLTYLADFFGYQLIYFFKMFNLIKLVEKRIDQKIE